jgi:hypothetical protein
MLDDERGVPMSTEAQALALHLLYEAADMGFMRFVADGRIVEHWNAVDNLGLLQQLGVLPLPGQATGQP